jgi:hypothetical protein
MKRFPKLCATIFLTLMFALPALAGDMGAGGRMGDPEPPGSKGDPEPPGRAAAVTSFDLTVMFALAWQGIFIK